LGEWVEGNWVWRIPWRREKLVCEKVKEQQLMQIITNNTFKKDRAYKWLVVMEGR